MTKKLIGTLDYNGGRQFEVHQTGELDNDDAVSLSFIDFPQYFSWGMAPEDMEKLGLLMLKAARCSKTIDTVATTTTLLIENQP
jgi:hypothetical protein